MAHPCNASYSNHIDPRLLAYIYICTPVISKGDCTKVILPRCFKVTWLIIFEVTLIGPKRRWNGQGLYPKVIWPRERAGDETVKGTRWR